MTDAKTAWLLTRLRSIREQLHTGRWGQREEWEQSLAEAEVALAGLAQSVERLKADRAFVRAGHKPDDGSCDHKHWTFEKHGRACTCGTFMVDFGD